VTSVISSTGVESVSSVVAIEVSSDQPPVLSADVITVDSSVANVGDASVLRLDEVSKDSDVIVEVVVVDNVVLYVVKLDEEVVILPWQFRQALGH
jgi:hypothetical protein